MTSVWKVALRSRRRSMPASYASGRSEEHTSELQSQSNLVCRLLLEKKKNTRSYRPIARAERTSRTIARAEPQNMTAGLGKTAAAATTESYTELISRDRHKHTV